MKAIRIIPISFSGCFDHPTLAKILLKLLFFFLAAHIGPGLG